MAAKLKELPLPTVNQMKRFAKKFSKKDWEKCCVEPLFVDAVSTSLDDAEFIAVKILSDDWIYEPET